MAEVFNLHRLNHPPQSTEPLPAEERFHHFQDPFLQHFDPLSYPHNSSNASFFEDYTTSFDLGFDLDENMGSPNCFIDGVEEDDEQMNYVINLFEPARVMEDPIWEFDSGRIEDPDHEFGFGPGLGGLQVTGIDSESDSEEFEVNSSFVNNGIREDDIFETVIAYNYHNGENLREDFEWEEVSERVPFYERENLNSVIERIEEISVSSHISPSEFENSRLDDDFVENSRLEDDGFSDQEQNIEWEVLLAANNSERNFEFDIDIPHNNLPEDYVLAMEYDTLFDQLVENETARKGTPPASKSAVENLLSVVLTKEEVDKNNGDVTCAVCKDEVPIGEKVTKMPCCHLYHMDCIIPWLGIRNTCPICRYELPTDNADYEKRKRERGGGSRAAPIIDNDLEGRYNFEFLP